MHPRGRSRYGWFALAVGLILSTPAHAKQPRQPRQIQEDRTAGFVGAVGCKSSSCHGGAGPKRDQYITWTKQDFHTRAYAVLINARSARMADALGLASAPESARCTVCHSPMHSVAPGRIVTAGHADDGVSCESCHGAAAGWLRGHTRTDWTYQTRVAAGMRDLRSLYVRANACVACHQNVDADVLRAGHPALTFELDSQSIAQPKHWKDDDAWTGPRSWLTGQAVALREMSWALASTPQPEAETVARWAGLAWVLSKATSGQAGWPAIPAPLASSNSEFSGTQTAADQLARRAPTSLWTNANVRQIIEALAGSDREFSQDREATMPVQRARAERLFLAIDRLMKSLEADVILKAEPALSLLYGDLQAGGVFDAPQFGRHLESFRLTFAQTQR